MVPAPTYKNLPVFGTSASLVVPIPETYLGGFLPGQVFPAEYENWLMNYITDNSLVNQTTATSLAAEVITILTAASISPVPASTDQLYTALNALYATVGALASEVSARAAADTALQASISLQPVTIPLSLGDTISGTTIANVPDFASGTLALITVNLTNNAGTSSFYTLRTPITGTSFVLGGMLTSTANTGEQTTTIIPAATRSGNSFIVSVNIPALGGAVMFITMKRNS